MNEYEEAQEDRKVFDAIEGFVAGTFDVQDVDLTDHMDILLRDGRIVRVDVVR